MLSLAFVLDQPGRQTTPAAKHEERVGTYSHAQKVTQRRKRELRVREQRLKPRSEVVGNHDLNKAANTQKSKIHGVSVQRLRYLRVRERGLLTPPPEPFFDRPLTGHSSWTADQRYGINVFLQLTVRDLNAINTNMHFWRVVAPAYSETWECVRDIVSAIACANEAIQHQNDGLFTTAQHLHLRAISSLRRDLVKLPLSGQVACCLLFEAYSVLRCDFWAVGKQIDTARMLTKSIPTSLYREDEFLSTVCDTLSKMNEVPAWSLWNPAYFLRCERLLYAQPQLHLELEPIDTQQDMSKSLVESIQRLSRQFSGRIRRNLSEKAYVDPQSRFAQDVLSEFRTWKTHFDQYVSGQHTVTDQGVLLQAELAWHLTFITFCTGVLDYGELVNDKPQYHVHFIHINELCARIFEESEEYSVNAGIKAFLHVVVPTLWLMVLMCRDPCIRNRAIAILYSRNYQESDFNSLVTARLAKRTIEIEINGRNVRTAADVPESDRIRIEGITYDDKAEEFVIAYSTGDRAADAPFHVDRLPWVVEGDLIKFNNAISALSQSCTLYRKAKHAHAPVGYIKPRMYENEPIRVYLSDNSV